MEEQGSWTPQKLDGAQATYDRRVQLEDWKNKRKSLCPSKENSLGKKVYIKPRTTLSQMKRKTIKDSNLIGKKMKTQPVANKNIKPAWNSGSVINKQISSENSKPNQNKNIKNVNEDSKITRRDIIELYRQARKDKLAERLLSKYKDDNINSLANQRLTMQPLKINNIENIKNSRISLIGEPINQKNIPNPKLKKIETIAKSRFSLISAPVAPKSIPKLGVIVKEKGAAGLKRANVVKPSTFKNLNKPGPSKTEFKPKATSTEKVNKVIKRKENNDSTIKKVRFTNVKKISISNANSKPKEQPSTKFSKLSNSVLTPVSSKTSSESKTEKSALVPLGPLPVRKLNLDNSVTATPNYKGNTSYLRSKMLNQSLSKVQSSDAHFNKEKLQEWLNQKGKNAQSFKHCHCFGLKPSDLETKVEVKKVKAKSPRLEVLRAEMETVENWTVSDFNERSPKNEAACEEIINCDLYVNDDCEKKEILLMEERETSVRKRIRRTQESLLPKESIFQSTVIKYHIECKTPQSKQKRGKENVYKFVKEEETVTFVTPVRRTTRKSILIEKTPLRVELIPEYVDAIQELPLDLRKNVVFKKNNALWLDLDENEMYI